MAKIRILYVITKLELGGAQKQLLSLIKNLDKEKFSPALWTAQEGLLFSEAASIAGLRTAPSRFLERPHHPLKDTFALFELCCFLKAHPVDIIHTHSSKAGILGRWAARMAGVKTIIHTVHGWSFHAGQNFFVRLLFLWLERITAIWTDKIIVVSGHDAKTGRDYRIGRPDSYELIRYGIEDAQFQGRNDTYRVGIRREFGLNSTDLVVGMVSCFKPQKSIPDFIKLASLAHKDFPRVKFLLIGDGVLRRKIEKMIKNLRLQDTVILAGWRRDIPQILSSLDVFVLTSLWEGLPISVLEAQASALAVVATNTGGVAEVVCEARTGFLVPPGNMTVMAEKLRPLLKDASLRKTIGQNAAGSLDFHYSLENMVKQTQELYERSRL